MKQSDHLLLGCPKKKKNLHGTKQQIPQKLPVTHDLFIKDQLLMLHKACTPFDIQKLFILFQIASGDYSADFLNNK